MTAEPSAAAAQSTVCAVVVTFHPDGGLPDRLSRVLPQVRRVFVIDNGSGTASAALLSAIGGVPGVSLIINDDNLGIAHALNQGIGLALDDGADFALLLDQDTEVDAHIVRTLLATVGAYPDARLAVVGSRFRDTGGRQAESSRVDAPGPAWQEVQSVITSGSLISLAAYAAVGAFRDDFFIDHVDTEYCFRARRAGYRVVETLEPLMSHTVGAPTPHRVFGTTKWTSNHTAERRYYMARNNTVLLREYGTSHTRAWRYKSFIRCLRLCKRIAYFETDKAAKIRAVAQGWWHGVRGRMGPRSTAGRSQAHNRDSAK